MNTARLKALSRRGKASLQEQREMAAELLRLRQAPKLERRTLRAVRFELHRRTDDDVRLSLRAFVEDYDVVFARRVDERRIDRSLSRFELQHMRSGMDAWQLGTLEQMAAALGKDVILRSLSHHI